MLVPATPTTRYIGFYNKRHVSITHQIVSVGSLKPQIVLAVRGCGPLNPNQRRDTPFKIPPILYILGKSAAEQPSTCLAIFIDLSLKPITKIWSASSRQEHTLKCIGVKSHRYMTSVLQGLTYSLLQFHFILYMYMFHTIWEFAQTGTHSVYLQFVQCNVLIAQIPRLH